ncbi:MAG: hypothetical protein K6B14_08435 [Lachnospiraceae bacterium]|nr:hypothetical protein [Lachnospiraceae bacterium]
MSGDSKSRLGYISAWAYALGCAVGWGSFMNPTNLFLPNAGPLGSLVGIVLAAVMMLLIGASLSYMAKRYPDSSGVHVYIGRIMGGGSRLFICLGHAFSLSVHHVGQRHSHHAFGEILAGRCVAVGIVLPGSRV